MRARRGPARTELELGRGDRRSARREVGPYAELPLLIALDGEVWLHQQSLPTTLDNLISDGAVPPLRAVLPSSRGAGERWADLSAGGSGVELVCDVVVPWTAGRRGVRRDRVVVAGQSLGGLTALRCGLLRSDAVYAVVSASASLWQDDLLALVDDASPVRFHLAHGAQEWVLDPPHRALAARMGELDLEVAVHDGGHDYAWWRGDLADGIGWALGATPPPTDHRVSRAARPTTRPIDDEGQLMHTKGWSWATLGQQEPRE